jgi:hypothetical protein
MVLPKDIGVGDASYNNQVSNGTCRRKTKAATLSGSGLLFGFGCKQFFYPRPSAA